jgi:hypothetical protein
MLFVCVVPTTYSPPLWRTTLWAKVRPMRPAARPVYDPHAFYPDDDGPEFGA